MTPHLNIPRKPRLPRQTSQEILGDGPGQLSAEDVRELGNALLQVADYLEKRRAWEREGQRS